MPCRASTVSQSSRSSAVSRLVAPDRGGRLLRLGESLRAPHLDSRIRFHASDGHAGQAWCAAAGQVAVPSGGEARLVAIKTENSILPDRRREESTGSAAGVMSRAVASCWIWRTETGVKVACRFGAVVPGAAANDRISTRGEMRLMAPQRQTASGGMYGVVRCPSLRGSSPGCRGDQSRVDDLHRRPLDCFQTEHPCHLRDRHPCILILYTEPARVTSYTSLLLSFTRRAPCTATPYRSHPNASVPTQHA